MTKIISTIKGFVNNTLREISYVHNKVKSWGSPKIWEIETTSYCPGQCIMCPKKYNFQRKQEHMPISLFKKIIDQVKPENQIGGHYNEGKINLFHYGEPCWYPHFRESINYCKTRGLYVIISDNASQFNQIHAKEAIETELDEVWLIIEGMDDETSMAIRGKTASFEQGKQNVLQLVEMKKKLNSTKPRVQVTMIRQPQNKHHWQKFLDYWSSIDGATPYLGCFSNFGGNIPQINQALLELQSINGQPDEDKRIKKYNSYRCYYPWHSVSILSDGRVVPCCRDMNGTYILGDLNNQTLEEIWNGIPMQQLRKEWISGKITNPLCASCNEANNEIGLPNRFYPGFNLVNIFNKDAFAGKKH
jgi:radical SAM protein with 4Fe4S-binding SPASM domain